MLRTVFQPLRGSKETDMDFACCCVDSDGNLYVWTPEGLTSEPNPENWDV